jgi:predicted metal-dependent enzyme (double-stranded beta helix superfamily)
MVTAVETKSVAAERRAAVAEAVAKARAIEAEKGVTREALEEIRQVMVGLAKRKELFPREIFKSHGPRPDDRIYRLSEDEGRRFALYINCGEPGTDTPPHDHTTWAIIAGIDGEEHQRIYRRTDDGSVPGVGTVEVDHEFSVTPGTAIAYMPDDIHAIHVRGDKPALHLHLYGRSFEEMTGRIAFDVDAGTYKTFPGYPEVMDDPGDG